MSSSHGRWVWRKSSVSEANGNSDCVEVGRWQKSDSSQRDSNSECVEVACVQALTAVRDSKNAGGGMLTVSESSWQAFRASITH